MLETKLPLEKLAYNAKRLPKFTEPVHLHSGYRLYKAGQVSGIEIIKGSTIEAEVGNYKVNINLDFLVHSSCSCYYKGICEHIVAGFMSVYEQIESPDKLFSISSTPNGSRVKYGDTTSKPTPAPKISLSTPPVGGVQPPLPTDSPEQWKKYYDLILFKHQSVHYAAFSYLFDRITRELEIQVKSWKHEIRSLFMIHAILFYFQRIEDNYHKDPSKVDCRGDYDGAFNYLYSSLYSISSELSVDASMMTHLESISALLAEKAFDLKQSPVDWQTVYCLLWWTILRDTVRAKREMRRVQALIDGSATTENETMDYQRILAYLETIAGLDERARERFNPSFVEHKNDILFILHTLANEKQWQRLSDWLAWYPLKRDGEYGYEMETYLRYCVLLSEQRGPVAEKGGELLKKHLPYSFEYYADYLIEARHFRRWVDLILWCGFTPLEIPTGALKLVESFDIRLLLPLYHQSIDRKIQERNRSAYQDAVQMLKKLRTYYKKLKQIHLWDEYMEHIFVQHRRLRAFCEELKKGNLMPS